MAEHFMRYEPWFFETVPPTEVRVSCWQDTTNDHDTYDIRVHAECAVRKIEAAAFAGIQLLVFPELYLHGPPIFKALDTNGDHDDEALEMIASAAGREGVAVATGYAKRSKSGIHNSAIVWHADGTVAFCCDKVRLATDDERKRFLPGDEGGWRAFDLKLKHRNVRCGVCICFDSDYMTSDAPRRIAEDGAEILLVPMAASSTGISELIRYDGVAEENNLFVLRANMAYDYRFEQPDGQHCGASSISIKNGRVIKMAGANEDTFVIHQLKLAPTEACGETCALTPGTRVHIHGLVKATEHNRKTGVISKDPAPEGRVGVKLDNGKSLAVKLGNVEVVSLDKGTS